MEEPEYSSICIYFMDTKATTSTWTIDWESASGASTLRMLWSLVSTLMARDLSFMGSNFALISS
jgi:hypothetical protein